jgi:hypothetical protein
MALIDFLRNVGNKVGNLQSKVGSTLGEALIGKQEPMIDYVDIKGVDVNSPEFAENAPIAEIGVTEAPRVGGLLNDIRNGAKENFATGFAAPNWEQTITPDGRKKGLGYRFGEGLGSFAKFAESPLGRGLLMAGIVGASGGSGLEALGYGAGAGLGNQQVRMKDQLYRNALEQQGVDTSNIKGYITDDPFKNYTLANYRNRNLDVKMHLGTLNDNTKRAQLINTMLNYGELDPVQAMELMNEYGLNVGQLDTSNQTKLLPYRQYAYKNGWNLGWANYGLKQEAANIKNEVLKELVGDTNGTAKQTVKVKAPNGKTGTIPIEQLEGALAAGYTRI